jgi:hypothetical protein
MKLCNQCHRITTGDPVYCNQCGASYDTKYCPRQHPNPRAAVVCSECGSRELSTPQPKFPFWTRPFLFLLGRLAGFLLLVGLIVFLGVFIYRLVTDPNGLLGLLFLGLALGLLLLLWMQLPVFIRDRLGRRASNRRKESR